MEGLRAKFAEEVSVVLESGEESYGSRLEELSLDAPVRYGHMAAGIHALHYAWQQPQFECSLICEIEEDRAIICEELTGLHCHRDMWTVIHPIRAEFPSASAEHSGLGLGSHILKIAKHELFARVVTLFHELGSEETQARKSRQSDFQ